MIESFPEIYEAVRKQSNDRYEMRLFGFKISSLSVSGPRTAWLRCPFREYSADEEELSSEEGGDFDDDKR